MDLKVKKSTSKSLISDPLCSVQILTSGRNYNQFVLCCFHNCSLSIPHNLPSFYLFFLQACKGPQLIQSSTWRLFHVLCFQVRIRNRIRNKSVLRSLHVQVVPCNLFPNLDSNRIRNRVLKNKSVKRNLHVQVALYSLLSNPDSNPDPKPDPT